MTKGRGVGIYIAFLHALQRPEDQWHGKVSMALTNRLCVYHL